MSKGIAISVAALILILVCIVGSGLIMSYVTGSAACADFAARNTQYEFQYSFWNGCLVKLDGTWLSATKMNWVDGELQIK